MTADKIIEKSVSVKGGKITFMKENIIHVEYDDDHLDLETVKNVFLASRQNSPWDVAPVLISGGTFTNQDREAREFSGSEEVMKHCSAIAFISSTMAEKLLANFFIKLMKPTKPTRFFATKEECINWLQQFESIPKK